MAATRISLQQRRIFHLLDEAEPFSEHKGGAISRWAANVLRTGDETIVCPEFDETWGFDAKRIYTLPRWQDTDRIHPVLYRMHWVLQKHFYLRIFEPLLAKTRPGDVLYVHNRPECASVLGTVAKARGVTVVLHMHNSHLRDASESQIAALQDCPIVFCSEFLRTQIHQDLPGRFARTFVIRNGADASKFRPEPRVRKTQPTVIFSGRLVYNKGVHVLLDAMRLLGEEGLNVRCQVLGAAGFGDKRKTSYVRRLERRCPANTELLGYKTGDALADLLRKADVFCCPSIWNDPFPLAPIEAMASGLPVVASWTGGIPEALAFGGGVLVPPDDAQALAEALRNVTADSGYRERLSREAVASAHKHFQWENVRESYEAFLEGLPA